MKVETIFKISVVFIVLGMFLMSAPLWADDDDRGCRGNCSNDDDGVTITVDGGDGGDASSDASSDASAEASAEGGDASAEGGDANNNMTLNNDNRRAPHAGIASGDSTADHQKVRSISGGWLTGSAGIRWDATDKELRILDRADRIRARGQIEQANKLECSAKVIYRAIGGTPAKCEAEMNEPIHEPVSATEIEHEAEIEALREEVAELKSREFVSHDELEHDEALQVQSTYIGDLEQRVASQEVRQREAISDYNRRQAEQAKAAEESRAWASATVEKLKPLVNEE